VLEKILHKEKASMPSSVWQSALSAMKPKAVYLLDPEYFDTVFNPENQREIGRLTDIHPAPLDKKTCWDHPELLREVEVIFASWGVPLLDEKFLAATPKLRAIFYAAGTVKSFVTDAFWASPVQLTSAYATNAVPVAEFTVAQIVCLLKRIWPLTQAFRHPQGFRPLPVIPGCYGTTVGLISLGSIARLVCEKLRGFDLKVIAYDPFLTQEEADQLNVRLCPLDEIFRTADLVSLHTPWLKETERLIRGHHFSSMKPNASFLNTARGAVVAEDEMIEVLKKRPDLLALLDVTHPEPPVEGSPLYSLPNVILTPHIAGSMQAECGRMGREVIKEAERFFAGQPMHWRLTKEKAATLA
jgi:phosphoglycerate dehydrogenase-like enzyme